MFGDFLKKNITSQAKYVQFGYGQVEPNHLSAQRTGQIYAQLPANKDIEVLENGQFVKYDYLNGEVNFTGAGEWMLVFNEIKLYRDHQMDCEFAMIKDNYQARVYSPFGGAGRNGNITAPDTVDFNGQGAKQSRWYNGVDEKGMKYIQIPGTFVPGDYALTTDESIVAGKTYYTRTGTEGAYVYTAVESPVVEDIGTYYEFIEGYYEGDGTKYYYDDVTAGPDMYEFHYNEDPFHIEAAATEKLMPEGTTMVPRVFKTNVGDLYTTNTIDEETLATGDILTPRATDGILTKLADGATATMQWQVVKVYTMPDHQNGVKLMRIA